MKKRLCSLIMALVMIVTFVPWSGISAFASDDGDNIIPESVGDPLRRPVPNVSLDVTDVTRVASAKYSMAKGTTVVKATPSGVPELSSSLDSSIRQGAYAGETPLPTTVTLTVTGFGSEFNDLAPEIYGTPTLTCTNNTSITFDAPVVSSNTYEWTMTGGTADAGTTLKFKVSFNVRWDNAYTYTKVTDTYELFGYSYVENIVFPSGAYVYTTVAKGGSNNDQVGDIRYVSRVLGKGVYGYISPSGTIDSEYGRGYHNFPTNLFSDTTDPTMCGSWRWAPERSGDSEHYYNGGSGNNANRATASVYMDPSTQTLESINLRMHFFENERPRGAGDEAGQPQKFNGFVVKSGFIEGYNETISSDSSAKTALNPTIVGNSELTFRYDTTYATLFGTGAAGNYTLVPYFYLHDNTTGMFVSSKDNHTRVATNLEIIHVNKGSLRSKVNEANVSWVETTTSRAPSNGTEADAIGPGLSGLGRGLLPQSWYYNSGWNEFMNSYDTSYGLLVKPDAAQADINYSATTLPNFYDALQLNLASTSTDYYGGVYNTNYSRPIDGVSSVNTGYYKVSDPYTSLKPLSELITIASEGTAYNLYYNGESGITDVLQFWPNNKELYTQSTREALETALSEGIAVSNADFNILYQPTIDRAARNLQTAIENLRFASLDIANAQTLYNDSGEIWDYSPVYNPFTVTNRYEYTSMAGTVYDETLPSGSKVYTYTLSSRNAAISAYDDVGDYVTNPSAYDTRSQNDLAAKVVALQNALDNLQNAPVVSSFWNQTAGLVDSALLNSMSSANRTAVQNLLTSGNNLAITGTTENQSALNSLVDELFLYLYTNAADYSLVNAAITGASARNNRITAVNPDGGSRSTLYYYTSSSRIALQSLIDDANNAAPVYDGYGNLVSLTYPVIDKQSVIDLADDIVQATNNLEVNGADFYYVKEQLDTEPDCDETHYTEDSWSVYNSAFVAAFDALQASGASEVTSWQATADYPASDQAQVDTLANDLFDARTSLVHKVTTVTFKLNYGDNETHETQTGDSGDDTITAPTTPSRYGYTFVGWYSEPECNNTVTFPMTIPLNDTTYYAKWDSLYYSVTFDGNGNTGGLMTAQNILYGQSAQLKANGFTRAGYSFEGWSTTASGSVEYNDGDTYTMLDEGVTLYAVWSINTYYIIYKVDGTEYQRVPYLYGEEIEILPDLEKEGYTFSGWPTTTHTTMPAGNIEMSATFSINSYTLTYQIDGESEAYQTQTYEYMAPVTAIEDPTRTGYDFFGWFDVPSTMPANDCIATGYFTVKSYTIAYFLDGIPLTSQTYDFGCEDIQPPTAPEKTGFTFDGWSNIPESMPASSIVSFGSYSRNSYNVDFMLDETQLYTTISVPYDYVITPPEQDPTREGYIFDGWIDIPQKMPAQNIEIQASWIAETQYTVSFMQGETVLKEVTGPEGTVVTPPEVTPPTGQNFLGWSPQVGDSVTITGDAVYIALFESIEYTLTFNINDEYYTSITGYYGDPITAPTYEVPEYHTFSGWDGVPATIPAQNMTFNATLTADVSTISFDINGGTGTAPTDITDVIGETVTLPGQGDITKEGYLFLGWAESAEATQAIESYTIPIDDTTLYAVWKLEIEPAIIASEGNNAVIDDEQGFIYGLKAGITLAEIGDYIITNTDSATVVVETSLNIGTGTRVALIDNESQQEIASYYIVIFGDVDGDGNVTTSDTTELLKYVAKILTFGEDSPFAIAANLDGYEDITTSDATQLNSAVSRLSIIDQTTGTCN